MSDSLPLHALEDKRFHTLLAAASVAVVLFDRQMSLRYVSPLVEQMLGYTSGECALFTTCFDLLHPDDQQSRHLLVTALQTPRAGVTGELHLQHKDGSSRTIEATLTNLLDDSTVEAVLMTLRDSSVSKRLEEEVQQAHQAAELKHQRLRSLFAQAPALIHILRGPEHVFEFFHPLGRMLVGGRDLTGMSVRAALPEYEGQGYFELLDHVYQTGESYHASEMRSLLAAADGTLIERFFDFIFQRWYEVDGSVAGILNFAVEVTDQVRARQQVEALAEVLQQHQEQLEHTNSELRHQRDELTQVNATLENLTCELAGHKRTLEASNRQLREMNLQQQDFLAVVSHEFRTALSGIQGFSELLCEQAWSQEEVKEFASDITTDARRLSRIIGEVLALEQMKSSTMILHRELVDVNALLQQQIEHIQRTTSRHHFCSRLDETLPLVRGDHELLTQGMAHLLSNAVSYSPGGGEIVVGSQREQGQVHISIQDQGVGIAEEAQAYIFEPYNRVDAAHTHYIHGTGLGLSVTREMVHLHGGRIWVESVLGQGSTFHVLLPLDLVTSS